MLAAADNRTSQESAGAAVTAPGGWTIERRKSGGGGAATARQLSTPDGGRRKSSSVAGRRGGHRKPSATAPSPPPLAAAASNGTASATAADVGDSLDAELVSCERFYADSARAPTREPSPAPPVPDEERMLKVTRRLDKLTSRWENTLRRIADDDGDDDEARRAAEAAAAGVVAAARDDVRCRRDALTDALRRAIGRLVGSGGSGSAWRPLASGPGGSRAGGSGKRRRSSASEAAAAAAAAAEQNEDREWEKMLLADERYGAGLGGGGGKVKLLWRVESVHDTTYGGGGYNVVHWSPEELSDSQLSLAIDESPPPPQQQQPPLQQQPPEWRNDDNAASQHGRGAEKEDATAADTLTDEESTSEDETEDGGLVDEQKAGGKNGDAQRPGAAAPPLAVASAEPAFLTHIVKDSTYVNSGAAASAAAAERRAARKLAAQRRKCEEFDIWYESVIYTLSSLRACQQGRLMEPDLVDRKFVVLDLPCGKTPLSTKQLFAWARRELREIEAYPNANGEQLAAIVAQDNEMITAGWQKELLRRIDDVWPNRFVAKGSATSALAESAGAAAAAMAAYRNLADAIADAQANERMKAAGGRFVGSGGVCGRLAAGVNGGSDESLSADDRFGDRRSAILNVCYPGFDEGGRSRRSRLRFYEAALKREAKMDGRAARAAAAAATTLSAVAGAAARAPSRSTRSRTRQAIAAGVRATTAVQRPPTARTKPAGRAFCGCVSVDRSRADATSAQKSSCPADGQCDRARAAADCICPLVTTNVLSPCSDVLDERREEESACAHERALRRRRANTEDEAAATSTHRKTLPLLPRRSPTPLETKLAAVAAANKPTSPQKKWRTHLASSACKETRALATAPTYLVAARCVGVDALDNQARTLATARRPGPNQARVTAAEGGSTAHRQLTRRLLPKPPARTLTMQRRVGVMLLPPVVMGSRRRP